MKSVYSGGFQSVSRWVGAQAAEGEMITAQTKRLGGWWGREEEVYGSLI